MVIVCLKKNCAYLNIYFYGALHNISAQQILYVQKLIHFTTKQNLK